MESGTLNVPGICGIFEGINKILEDGADEIGRKEMELAAFIWRELSKMDEVELFTDEPKFETHAPVISFVFRGLSGEETAAKLSKKGVATRGGFHCSALAHLKMGTEKRGTCRISIGPMNTFDEAVKLIGIIKKLIKN